MKRLFIFTFFSLVLSTPSQLFAPPPEAAEDALHFSFGVKKKTDHLYVGKRADGLYFVMERIDESSGSQHTLFWHLYVRDEYDYHDKYKGKWRADEIPIQEGFPRFKARDHNLTDGLQSFKASLERYRSRNELWIAYATSKEIERNTQIGWDDIEIAMTVLTDQDVPMVTHIGIGRSFQYLLNAIKADGQRKMREEDRQKWGVRLPDKDDFKIHTGLSMGLHSFAAKVMRFRDPRKMYMMSAPNTAMRDIMVKTLKDKVFVGDTAVVAKAVLRRPQQQQAQPERPIRHLKSIDISGKMDEYEAAINELDKKIKALEENREGEADNMERLCQQKAQKEKEFRVLEQQYKSQIKEERDQARIASILGEIVEKLEIQELIDQVEITEKTSPIKVSLCPLGLKIVDKERKKVVFDHDQVANTIVVNEQKLVGEQVKRYDWFYHPDMPHGNVQFNPYVTIDLDVLSSHLQLVE